jgi:Cytochrome c554 and c-prime
MRVPRRVKLLAGVLGTVGLFAAWTSATLPRVGPHSALDLWMYKSAGDSLAVQYSTYFATAGRCAGCHGRDPQGIASISDDSVDVNLVDDWRSTMMANSARDPFFRAKLEHEVLVNPGHQGEIEGKCLSCHAPLAKHEEDLLGHAPFTAAMLDTSIMGQDGVSCMACHGQNPDSAGTLFSGELRFDSLQVYGPYPDDEINAAIMQFFVGFTPQQGQHIQDGRVCAGCHTLITETLDLNGNATGDEFVEQATWHEWKNSIYNGTQNCRECHMPRIQDSIILASDYPFLPPHSPFGLHHLAGGNVYMLQLMKQYRAALGIPATETQFDSTIARTLNNLQHRSIELDVSIIDRDADTAFIDVRLLNLTGHKFPSGYPSRRAFVELNVLDANGDTLFNSGGFNSAYEVNGHDADYEPHQDVIKSEGQAQIYEMVMGDVNDDVTTVLERAKSALKDNRLTPQGFSSSHYTYDTCLIAGVPAADDDFNLDALGIEGTGADIVHYHAPMGGHAGAITVHARVWYQPVPPRWNAEMFSNTGARIDSFRTMVDAMDGTPTLVEHDSTGMGPLGIDDLPGDVVRISPNPTSDAVITLIGRGITGVQVYTIAGQVAPAVITRPHNAWHIALPSARGTYLLIVRRNGADELHRVVRQ